MATRLLTTYGETHGLRTLDAIQVAITLDLKNAGLITVVVASDRRLCTVADLLGCPSLDPANPDAVIL